MRFFSRHQQNPNTSSTAALRPEDRPPEYWENQAIPAMFRVSEGSWGVRRREKENRDMLTGKLAELKAAAKEEGSEAAPRITGYWAVSQQVAEAMAERGVSAVIHDMDAGCRDIKPSYQSTVNAWDTTAAQRALSRARGLFQGDSSQDVRVVKYAMKDPEPDNTGLLQWTARPENVEFAGMYTPDQFSEELQAMRSFAGRLAVQGEPGPESER